MKHRRGDLAILIFLAVCLDLAGCGKPERVSPGESLSEKAAARRPAEAPEVPKGAGAQADSTRGIAEWKIATPDGRTELRAKARQDGYRLYDGADRVIGEIKVEADRIKVKDAQDRILYKIKQKADGSKLYDANDREIVQIKRKEGGYRIKDARERELAAIKPKDGGSFKFYGARQEELGKAKPKDGAVELEDPRGQRIAKISGSITPQAASFWGLKGLDPLQRAGLMVSVMHFE